MSGCPDPALLSALDEVAGERRCAVLEHVRTCGPCRSRTLAGDPCRQFALLGLTELPPEALDRLSRRVSESLDREVDSVRRDTGVRRHGRSRVRSSRFARFPMWGSIAASLLLAAAFVSFVEHRFIDPASSRSPASAAESRRLDAVDVVNVSSGPVGELQLLSSPGSAEIMDLSVGDTQVVMIFDEALGI